MGTNQINSWAKVALLLLVVSSFGVAKASSVGGIKTAFAAKAEKPVVIDGVLDDGVWQSAPSVTRLVDTAGLPLDANDDRKTEFKLAYDRDYLYVAVKCVGREEFVKNECSGEIKREGGSKWDNVLELYFDPGRTLSHYTGVWLYADGKSWGMRDFQKLDPEVGIRYAMRTEGKVWTVEVAFPANGRNHDGAEWGFNFIRYVPGYGILGMWRYIPDCFQSPGCFGRIYLGPKESMPSDEEVAKRAREEDRKLAATLKPMTLIKYFDCDDWYWEPFSYSGTVELSKAIAAGETPTYEYKGPIVRKCRKWYPDIGCAIEGVKGMGWRLKPRSKDAVAGPHGYFDATFAPGKRYKLEGFVKGEGKFSLKAWYYSVNKKTKEKKLYRYLNVYQGELSEEWTKFETEFELPALPDELVGELKNPFGIAIPAKTDFAIDELKIWEY